jgi:hypothetical protein
MNADPHGTGKVAAAPEDQSRQSVWRSPMVVAAIGGALITGFFGVIHILVRDGTQQTVEVPKAEAPRTTERPATSATAESAYDFSFTSYAKTMADVRRALRKEAGAVPIPRRLEAIAALRAHATEAAPADHAAQSVEILVSYLAFATEERRGVADAYTAIDDRDSVRVTRDESVVAAIAALQTARRSVAPPLQVRIGAINFSHFNLEGTDLSGLDATHCDLRHAFLSGCHCEGAIFDHADLRDAVIWTKQTSNFRATRFTDARIAGSKWSNVDFTGSNIDAASGRPVHWKDIVPAQAQALFP